MYVQTESEYFYFDPNGATDHEWIKLGFNGRQIRNIRNYQASGGKFKRKEDLQKLYTISAIQYQRVEPYIRISENNRTAVKPSKTWDASSRNIAKQDENNVAGSQRIAKPKIEINTADSSLLTQLPGIGPVFAARTVKYRNAIGGFINVTQLSEVYGINADLVERLTPLVSVDSSLIRKISLNTANLNTLIKHPYINEQQARGIIEYRKRQNRINNLNELIKNNIIERETAEKIKPYLSLE
jgi:competence ComEA-like helix-hairpin-helix protein